MKSQFPKKHHFSQLLAKLVKKNIFFPILRLHFHLFCIFLKNTPEHIDPSGHLVFYLYRIYSQPLCVRLFLIFLVYSQKLRVFEYGEYLCGGLKNNLDKSFQHKMFEANYLFLCKNTALSACRTQNLQKCPVRYTPIYLSIYLI